MRTLIAAIACLCLAACQTAGTDARIAKDFGAGCRAFDTAYPIYLAAVGTGAVPQRAAAKAGPLVASARAVCASPPRDLTTALITVAAATAAIIAARNAAN